MSSLHLRIYTPPSSASTPPMYPITPPIHDIFFYKYYCLHTHTHTYLAQLILPVGTCVLGGPLRTEKSIRRLLSGENSLSLPQRSLALPGMGLSVWPLCARAFQCLWNCWVMTWCCVALWGSSGAFSTVASPFLLHQQCTSGPVSPHTSTLPSISHLSLWDSYLLSSDD